MVVDKDDTYVYAYNQTNGERLEAYEFDLAERNDNPWGLWCRDSVMWVTDIDDESVYAYNTFGRAPNSQLNLRLSLENMDPRRGVTGNNNLLWVVDAEDNHVYVLRHKDFRHPDDEIDIGEVITPQGIWTDGSTMYVVDTGINGGPGLVAYNVGNGARNSGKDVDLSHTGGEPVSIWSDGSQAWVKFAEHRAVHVYSLSAGSEISRNFPILLKHQNDDATGIWCDGTTMWVSDSEDNKIYAYSFATGLDQTDKDFDLDSGNTDPGQIWGDGETLWVMDAADKHAYAYDLSTGTRQEAKEFRPVPQNNDFNGAITGHGLRFWVVDSGDEKLYAYGKSNTPPSFNSNSKTLSIHYTWSGRRLIGPVPEVTEVDEGDTLTFSVSGADSGRFAVDSNTGDVYLTNNAGSFTAGTELSIKVSVSDGKNVLDGSDNRAYDAVNVTIWVLPNFDPFFNTADGAVFSVSEDIEEAGTVVELDTTDLDGDTLSYTLTYDNATAHTPFTISDGHIKIATGESLDYESQDSYQLDLSISDGKDEDGNVENTIDDSIAVEIRVTNVDESGEVSLDSAHPQVDTKIVASLTDPDDVDLEDSNQVNWVVEKSAGPESGSWTDLSDSNTTSTTFEYTPITADVGYHLRFTANYGDRQSDTTQKSEEAISQNAVLAAPPVNLAPTFTESAPITRSLAEDADIISAVGEPVLAEDPDDDVLIYGLTRTGTTRFQIHSGTAQIALNSTLYLSYETKHTYYVTVWVRDSKDQDGNADTAWDSSALVRINVTNVEEAGNVALTRTTPRSRWNWPRPSATRTAPSATSPGNGRSPIAPRRPHGRT